MSKAWITQGIVLILISLFIIALEITIIQLFGFWLLLVPIAIHAFLIVVILYTLNKEIRK